MAYMSQEGYDKLVAQLRRMEAVDRPRVIEAIREARDKGDLSENAEYDAAKEEQGLLEGKINELKQIIADAKIIDASKLKTDSVQILNKVELKNLKNGMKMSYTIVSDTEANLKQGKISVNTPIAKGLLGKKVGDQVAIKVPSGIINLEILSISFKLKLSLMATIFSRIVAGEIPCYKIAENEKFFSFLDINPLVKGHTLVIPKQEVDYIFDLSDEDLAEMTVFAKKIAVAVKKAFPCRKVGVAVLGLEVPHAHIHLVPMQTEKDLILSNPKLSLPAEEMEKIAAAIRAQL